MTEQEPEQVTAQLVLEPSQLTLLLEPTSKVQVELPVQLRLALGPVLKLHFAPLVQLRLALVPAVMSQVLPLVQAPPQEVLQVALPQLPPLVH